MSFERPDLSRGRSLIAPVGSTVVMAQGEAVPDHYAGLDAALAARGMWCDRLLADQAPVRLGPKTKVVIIKDQTSFIARYALEQGQRVGATIVLLMDGIVEYRNTFLNPAVGSNFLRLAPADVVACAGEMDRQTLAALGNHAVATGLPRLAGLNALPPLTPDRAIMVATANTPAFNPGERARLLAALTTIRDDCATAHIRVHWRLTGALENDLGVMCDRRPLPQVLADVRAVIATPTTLLVESMLAGRPTILLDPHPVPCWQVAPWIIRTATKAATADHRPDLAALHAWMQSKAMVYPAPSHAIGAALAATSDDMARQRDILDQMHPAHAPAADLLANLCLELCCKPRRTSHPKRVYAPVQTPAPLPLIKSRPRVVNMVYCDGSPVGGVQTWALRLAREFAAGDLGYDVRTLLVTPQPEAVPAWASDPATHTSVCVFDPTGDHAEILQAVHRSCAALEPSIIIPNYTDLCYMVAHQLRATGTRIIAVAHTDHDYYRNLISTYSGWDAGVGVSNACAAWLATLANHRPVRRIVCGVPISPAPREVAPRSAPIQLMYCGRMVQEQKRIFDLLTLIDELEARSVSCVLHMVGDGPDLPAWRRELSTRRLNHVRVECHGRCEPQWVQDFLSQIDLSVLVSDYEGMSVSMMEAMGAGVLPCVTRVSSGVDELIRDGENGVLCPVSAPGEMADRIAALSMDRDLLARIGAKAWDTAREACSAAATATAYREVFDLAMRAPALPPASDLGLRPGELWRWRKTWTRDPKASHDWIRRTLEVAGYKRIALDQPTPGCDAVLVRTDMAAVTDAQIDQWRAQGLGVACSPHVTRESISDSLRRILARIRADGFSRVAVYGTGKHTRLRAPVFYEDFPIVGFIDDNPPECGHMFGLPIVTLPEARDRLNPDAILLSSDAWEAKMWERCEPLRTAGIRVIPMYGTYAEHAMATV
ncbi:MAG: glycosyltransferase family 4 protein [Phycisphaerales bacterium]|jgi:glycosyltransferase involved in cell wall biosynthesis